MTKRRKTHENALTMMVKMVSVVVVNEVVLNSLTVVEVVAAVMEPEMGLIPLEVKFSIYVILL